MKANELRIGNYFYPDVFKGDEYDVITAKDIVELDFDPLDDYYKPIPLTPEWLERCGFYKQPDVKWFGNGADYQDERTSTTHTDYILGRLIVRFVDWVWGYTNHDLSTEILLTDSYYPKTYDGKVDSVKVEHLHQLQNLYFALTGEELTIIT